MLFYDNDGGHGVAFPETGVGQPKCKSPYLAGVFNHFRPKRRASASVVLLTMCGKTPLLQAYRVCRNRAEPCSIAVQCAAGWYPLQGIA